VKARAGKPMPKQGAKGHPLCHFKYPAKLTVPAKGKNDLEQKEAKLMLPPTAHIWRANARGAWAVHLRPHRRHTEPWADWGWDSYLACRAAVRWVWAQWLDDQLLPRAHCPIKDLWAEDAKM